MNSPADIDADLVLDKSTAIQFDLNANFSSSFDTTPVTIKITSTDGANLGPIFQTTAGEIFGSITDTGTEHGKSFTISNPAYLPKKEGTWTLSFNMEYLGKNTTIEKKVRVKKTNPLNISYFPVGGQFDCLHQFPGDKCIGGPLKNTTLAQFAQDSTQFMQAAFPFADGNVTGTPNSDVFQAADGPDRSDTSILTSLVAITDVALDALEFAIEKETLDPSINRAVGVVPTSYFRYRGLPTVYGFNLLGAAKSILITEDSCTTTAHEIAHTYGVDHQSETDLNGFWVPPGQNLSGPILNARNIMLINGGAISGPASGQWVDSYTYGTIFQESLVMPSDPELLLVAGTISRYGSIHLKPVEFLPAGFQTESVLGGESTIIAKDERGNLISSTAFSPSFAVELSSDQFLGTLPELEFAPFLLKIPFTSDLSTIEIINKGEILSTFFPNSLLISDTIKAIPDTSFNQTPSLKREILLKKSDQIDELNRFCLDSPTRKFQSNSAEDERINRCSNTRIILVLQLRDEVDRNLNNSTLKWHPLDLIKSEALRNIDSAILRVIPNQIQYGTRAVYQFNILPYSQGNDDSSLFKITAASQGVHGSVNIKNGRATYVPNSSRPQEDSFTINIRNPWGATVTKTMTISPDERR